MAKTLCYGTTKVYEKNTDEKLVILGDWIHLRPLGVKRKRLTCPVCKRRIMSSVMIDEDGDLIHHSIPPHKPKGWWKKHKRMKK